MVGVWLFLYHKLVPHQFHVPSPSITTSKVRSLLLILFCFD
jgi:hypothetical protein